VGVWREPWDDAPFPDLTTTELAAIIAKHELGIALDQVERLPSTGVVHTVYGLGGRYVLRVPKPIPDATGDTYTEAVAAPAAHRSGVRTPRLVVFDDDRDLLDVPFTIFERWKGVGLALITTTASDKPELCHALGHDLATLHLGVAACPDPNGWLDDTGRSTSADELIADAVAEGAINADNARTLQDWFAKLGPAVLDADFRRFVHNDIQPANLLVSSSAGYVGIIDWGDAAWGDPALDFRSLPARVVPLVLAGYRRVAPVDGDDTVEARIWWDQLFSAVYNLRRDRVPGRIEWSRPPGARILELFRFVAAGGEVGRF
jgi:aminoglycoside phosphotransferase (APT) family kinase protein